MKASRSMPIQCGWCKRFLPIIRPRKWYCSGLCEHDGQGRRDQRRGR